MKPKLKNLKNLNKVLFPGYIELVDSFSPASNAIFTPHIRY